MMVAHTWTGAAAAVRPICGLALSSAKAHVVSFTAASDLTYQCETRSARLGVKEGARQPDRSRHHPCRRPPCCRLIGQKFTLRSGDVVLPGEEGLGFEPRFLYRQLGAMNEIQWHPHNLVRCHEVSVLSKALAIVRSRVSKPSVNQS
jgi:hypothetical protein